MQFLINKIRTFYGTPNLILVLLGEYRFRWDRTIICSSFFIIQKFKNNYVAHKR